MRQWGVFVVKASGLPARRALKQAIVEALAREPGVHQLVFGDAGRHGLTLVKIADFEGPDEEWDWYAAHRTLAARLARAVKAPAFAVLCVNGSTYEEWVAGWDARGRKAWSSRVADSGRIFIALRKLETERAGKERIASARRRTPFGRLAEETGVGLWKLVDPETGDPLPRWTGGWEG